MRTTEKEQDRFYEELHLAQREGYQIAPIPAWLQGFEVDAVLKRRDHVRVIEVRNKRTLGLNSRNDLRKISRLCCEHDVELDLIKCG